MDNFSRMTASLREMSRQQAERQWRTRITSRLQAIQNEVATHHLGIDGLKAEAAKLNAELQAGHKWDGRLA